MIIRHCRGSKAYGRDVAERSRTSYIIPAQACLLSQTCAHIPSQRVWVAGFLELGRRSVYLSVLRQALPLFSRPLEPLVTQPSSQGSNDLSSDSSQSSSNLSSGNGSRSNSNSDSSSKGSGVSRVSDTSSRTRGGRRQAGDGPAPQGRSAPHHPQISSTGGLTQTLVMPTRAELEAQGQQDLVCYCCCCCCYHCRRRRLSLQFDLGNSAIRTAQGGRAEWPLLPVLS